MVALVCTASNLANTFIVNIKLKYTVYYRYVTTDLFLLLFVRTFACERVVYFGMELEYNFIDLDSISKLTKTSANIFATENGAF